MSYRKKLIEVSLPLDAINKESIREGYIYKGNPSAIHKWWSGKPLATSRAVLFASLVDDPSSKPDNFPTEEAVLEERKRLFKLIADICKWENVENETILKAIKDEILKSTGGNPPAVFDPFCGGGSIPLEAQRLGLQAYGSDLNPVAVVINKALIEIPPRFANRSPVNPENQVSLLKQDWHGAEGLASDIKYYGRCMYKEAKKRIGDIYPKVKLPKELGNEEKPVMAWLWARAVECPNPACGLMTPLVNNFWLSTKTGKKVWAQPFADHPNRTVKFQICAGTSSPPLGTVNRRGAKCVICDAPIPFDYIRTEGKAGRLKSLLMALAVKTPSGRAYLPADAEQANIQVQIPWENVPDTNLPDQALGFRVQSYGITKHRDLFTPRQLMAMITFSDLVTEIRAQVIKDAVKSGWEEDLNLEKGGNGAVAYAEAIATYLAFACNKYAMYGCAFVPWYTKEDRPSMLFGNHVLSMVWDFVEINPFSDIGGSFIKSVSIIADSVEALPCQRTGHVFQMDATHATFPKSILISTDPPYYDNIPYADLSDFFYIWLRRSLNTFYPTIFGTLLVPKDAELVADPHRYGSKTNAEKHFLEGIREAFSVMRRSCNEEYPITVYYAFKQSENEQTDGEEGISMTVSTGWETMLEGLIQAGFSITGTWPMRTERSGRLRETGSNALASSIVLVCRPRQVEAPIATRGDFLRALRKELPKALRELQHGGIAPVDLAQASIGPGMSIYSRYSQVVESDGTPLRVRTALQMINQELDASLREQEGEYDNQTRWAVDWFEQVGMQEAAYGIAETLSKARNVSVSAMEKSGLVEAKAGKVRLRKREEFSEQWTTSENSVWEIAQRMIHALLNGKGEHGGERGAAHVLRQALSLSGSVRDLTYRLYSVCERKGWAQEALAYNSLIASWSQITDLAHRKVTGTKQETLL